MLLAAAARLAQLAAVTGAAVGQSTRRALAAALARRLRIGRIGAGTPIAVPFAALLLALQLAILGGDAGHGGRDGAKDRLQGGVFLLAALTVVVLDVLGLLLGDVDAVAVIPFLAAVAAAVNVCGKLYSHF